MKKKAFQKVRGLGLFVFWWTTGCAMGEPDLLLQLQWDQHACIGGAHYTVLIEPNEGTPLQFSRYGLYFDPHDPPFPCKFSKDTFGNLPFGNGFSIHFKLFDSSDDMTGLLVDQKTLATFDVDASSPNQALPLMLVRRPEISHGTIVVQKAPDTWIDTYPLEFDVKRTSDNVIVRTGKIDWKPGGSRKSPFPLVISNLPWPATSESYGFTLRGMQGGDAKKIWTGNAELKENTTGSVVLY